jgi:iron complex transport system permease protein
MVARTTATGLAGWLLLIVAVAVVLGLSAGSEGWSLAWQADWVLIRDIRAPRTLGALAAGALLGLAGAIAQGLFRNPLADPYLLGSAAGAGLGVVLVLAAGGLLGTTLGHQWSPALTDALLRTGLVGAAFVGALVGVGLTVTMGGGAGRPTVLLLSGVVVGVLLTALADAVVMLSPEALRGKQVFLLGSTSFLGWGSLAVLVAALSIALPMAVRMARAMDALVLGDATAASLGLPLARVRLLLVALMAFATGAAVAQVGLVAFVGLVAPHLVRRSVVVTHGRLLALSALAGGVLLLLADVAARSVLVPQELPVGMLTAVLGGLYLLRLLRQRR